MLVLAAAATAVGCGDANASASRMLRMHEQDCDSCTLYKRQVRVRILLQQFAYSDRATHKCTANTGQHKQQQVAIAIDFHMRLVLSARKCVPHIVSVYNPI